MFRQLHFRKKSPHFLNPASNVYHKDCSVSNDDRQLVVQLYARQDSRLVSGVNGLDHGIHYYCISSPKLNVVMFFVVVMLSKLQKLFA